MFRNYYGTTDSFFDECFTHFLERCNIPIKLGEFGVIFTEIPRLVDNAFHPDQFYNMIYTSSGSEVRTIYTKSI